MPLLYPAMVGYLIGCFVTGYYLVRVVRGTDVRAQGSGSAGARNVGRVLGWTGFWVVFAMDIAKGALAVWVASLAGTGLPGMLAAMIAVTLGHIFPVQLGFRGGKGACTSFGALLVFNSELALVGATVCFVILILVRHSVAAFVSAFVLLPVVAYLMGLDITTLAGITGLLIVILAGFRDDVAFFLRRFRSAPLTADIK